MASDNCHGLFLVSFLYLLNNLLQFWTRSKDPDKDKDTLIQLYNCGFLQTTPENHLECIQDALDICGIDACYYARINGPGGVQMENQKITPQRLSPEKKEQIENFFSE
ncbi:hypothetical protein RhiirC2_782718 [Rhizophagus irregularis]|uniref:Uncharacterized protein n=1 Tax=Rhizophagus irregularis TaxID=588596 RepID=A0A2N1N2F8_9GLOM|nr:hypothetical protein RhiirC2_782718 [Rhizophagus irregularis]